MASLSLDAPKRLLFSEFVNIVTVLAMFEAEEARRFVFGNLDPAATGMVHLQEYAALVAELAKSNGQVAPGRLRKIFMRYADKYSTVSFEKVCGLSLSHPWMRQHTLPGVDDGLTTRVPFPRVNSSRRICASAWLCGRLSDSW
jgi:hypothetical protein